MNSLTGNAHLDMAIWKFKLPQNDFIRKCFLFHFQTFDKKIAFSKTQKQKVCREKKKTKRSPMVHLLTFQNHPAVPSLQKATNSAAPLFEVIAEQCDVNRSELSFNH